MVVVAVVAVLAAAAVPLTNGANEAKLDAAAAEVGNVLRFALAESQRTGRHVLVDTGTAPGHVLILNSDATAARGTAVIDPLTKRAMDIDVTTSPLTAGVKLNARFVAPDGTYSQLLIGPGPGFWAAQSSVVKGVLQPGSGVDLVNASRTATVGFDSVSGRVVLR